MCGTNACVTCNVYQLFKVILFCRSKCQQVVLIEFQSHVFLFGRTRTGGQMLCIDFLHCTYRGSDDFHDICFV